jgi:pyrroloquinoline quinone biosynthesis protein B
VTQGQPWSRAEFEAQLRERGRSYHIHLTNPNPIIDEDSPERAEHARAGIEVCEDGMEIIL